MQTGDTEIARCKLLQRRRYFSIDDISEHTAGQVMKGIVNMLRSRAISQAFDTWLEAATEIPADAEAKMMPLLAKGSTDTQILRHYSMAAFALKRIQVLACRQRNSQLIPPAVRATVAKKMAQERERVRAKQEEEYARIDASSPSLSSTGLATDDARGSPDPSSTLASPPLTLGLDEPPQYESRLAEELVQVVFIFRYIISYIRSGDIEGVLGLSNCVSVESEDSDVVK